MSAALHRRFSLRFVGRVALPAIVLLAAAIFTQRLLAEIVIDDAALEKRFTDGLSAPGVEGLSGARAEEVTRAAEGKKTLVQPAGTAAAPEDYASICRSVVVVGSIDHCKDCGGFHMGAVSSGWFIDAEGHVATNYHVAADKEAGEIGVMTFRGEVFPVKKVLAADREGDAAILQIDAGGKTFSALPLAASAETGERIRVVGHPDGRFYSLSEGIVSRVFTEETEKGDGRRTWLTVTADYGAGSSGAPVLNGAGQVVGMVSSTAALLADTEEGKKPEASDVQMVFRDCVSLGTIRGLLEAPSK